MTETVKVTSTAGIAAAIPYLLGFHPSESLVLVGLEPPRDQMVFSMRLDLPQDGTTAFAGFVADRMRATGFNRVVLAVFTDERFDFPDLPRRRLIEELLELLEVREALLVQNGRYWSYLCEDNNCCPPRGQELLRRH